MKDLLGHIQSYYQETRTWEIQQNAEKMRIVNGKKFPFGNRWLTNDQLRKKLESFYFKSN